MKDKGNNNPDEQKKVSPEEELLISEDFRKMTEMYMKGNLSEEESHSIERNIDALHQRMEGNYPMDEREVKAGVQRVLDKVITRTDLEAAPVKRSLLRLNYNFRIFSHVAEAAVIALVIGFSYFLYTQQSLHGSPELIALVADAAVETITLPDGSRVYLNRGSKLSYDKKTFNGDKRNVQLEGEAFFEVAKNPQKPFIVEGDGLRTTVKGTSFNVKSFAGTDLHIVSVRDGEVEVESENKQKTLLTKDQQVTYSRSNGSFKTESSEWENAGGWIDGKLIVFNKVGKDELCQKMEQYYQMQLYVDDSDLKSMEFSASYHIDDVPETIIQDVCNIYGLKYSIKGKRIILRR